MTDLPEIPASMKPWHGGDRAPEDWDNGDVLLDWGSGDVPAGYSRFTMCQHEEIDWNVEPNPWRHDIDTNRFALIIAYTPKPTPSQPDQSGRAIIPPEIRELAKKGPVVVRIEQDGWSVRALEAERALHGQSGGAGEVDEWSLVNRLRDEEADSVTILCDNPEGAPNNAVECNGFWTGFRDRRFEGDTIKAALVAAVAAKDESARVGYPPISEPGPWDAGQEMREALEALALAEKNYRAAHDLYGDGSREAGRAWDLVRRAIDHARALPAKQTGEGE